MHSIPITDDQRKELIKHYPELHNLSRFADMDYIDYQTLMDLAMSRNPAVWQLRKFRKLIKDLND